MNCWRNRETCFNQQWVLHSGNEEITYVYIWTADDTLEVKLIDWLIVYCLTSRFQIFNSRGIHLHPTDSITWICFRMDHHTCLRLCNTFCGASYVYRLRKNQRLLKTILKLRKPSKLKETWHKKYYVLIHCLYNF